MYVVYAVAEDLLEMIPPLLKISLGVGSLENTVGKVKKMNAYFFAYSLLPTFYLLFTYFLRRVDTSNMGRPQIWVDPQTHTRSMSNNAPIVLRI